MQTISAYSRLIRLPNLIFLGVMQFLMQRTIVYPVVQSYGLETSPVYIWLLITATVLIAAGGYVVNDYFDIKIDAINQPQKQIVGKIISRKNAMSFYQILTAVGVVCGLFLSFRAKSFTLAFIFIMAPGMLWFYSSNYKRQFLTGNLIVSFNTALSVLSVAICAVAFLKLKYGTLLFHTTIPRDIYGWLCGFSLFAFILTWIREIIKDMEDEKGDREMECRTMPIKWGMSRTKVFLYILIALTIISLLLINKFFIHFPGSLTIRYTLIGLVLPLIILIYLIYKARTSSDYHQASTFSKFIMIIGVLYCLVFYYLQAKNYHIPFFGMTVV